MLPLSFCLKNLFRRPDQSFLLIIGCTAVISLIVTAAAINQAMKQTLGNTGDRLNIIFLGAGSEESVERSEVKRGVDEIIASSVGGIRQLLGKPSVSPEVHFNGMLNLPKGTPSQVLIRGVSHHALWVHQRVRLLEGRFPNSGEIMVGRLAYQKLGIKNTDLGIGKTMVFNGEHFTISGVFDALGTVMEAEVWMPLQDLMTYTKRENLSCVIVSMLNEDVYGDFDAFAKRRLDLELVTIKESEYYNKLSVFYAPIRWMAWICTILLAIGAILGGLNALYAAFASRVREFGTFQAIGFNRIQILISLVQESCIITLIACIFTAIIVYQILNGLCVPFSIGVFELDYDLNIVYLGIVSAILLGVFGGLPPALKCLSLPLPETLRK